MALAEFEKAQAIDPSNAAADQEIKKTMSLIAAKTSADAATRLNPNPSRRKRPAARAAGAEADFARTDQPENDQ